MRRAVWFVALVACHRAATDEPAPIAEHRPVPPPPPPPAPVVMHATERATAPPYMLHSLASDGAALYWRGCVEPGSDCAMFRLAHDRAVPTQLLTGNVRAFALAGDAVYALDDRAVVRVAKTGGATTTIERDLPLFDLVVDGDAIFATIADTRVREGGTGRAHPGALVRFSTAGGPVTTIAPLALSLPHLAIDDRRVYLTGDTGLLAIPRDGGELVELSHDASYPPSVIALDADHAYINAGGEVRRIAKTGGEATAIYKGLIILDIRADARGVFAARNVAFDRGAVAEKPALVALPAGTITELEGRPMSLALDATGVYAIVTDLKGEKPDRIVAFAR